MNIINLLPKPKQQELRYRAQLFAVRRLVLVVGASLALVALSMFVVRLYLGRFSGQVQSAIEQERGAGSTQANTELKKQIKTINGFISDYNTTTADVPHWSKLLRAFGAVVPEDLAIQTFTVDVVKKQVTIFGFSPTRDAVIELYNNILGDREHFSGVNYPLENVSRPANVSFHFTFNVQPEVLK